MHEFGLCQSVLAAVEGRAAGRRVTGVRIRIGALHRVWGEAFDQAFSLVAQGTVADGAEIDLVVVPVRVTCRTCGSETESADQLALCPGCGSSDVAFQGGDELILESLVIAADSPSKESPQCA